MGQRAVYRARELFAGGHRARPEKVGGNTEINGGRWAEISSLVFTPIK